MLKIQVTDPESIREVFISYNSNYNLHNTISKSETGILQKAT